MKYTFKETIFQPSDSGIPAHWVVQYYAEGEDFPIAEYFRERQDALNLEARLVNEWIFTEDQRDAVCNGELCPKCLGNNVICTGAVPDGINLNCGYHCNDCTADWEGY